MNVGMTKEGQSRMEEEEDREGCWWERENGQLLMEGDGEGGDEQEGKEGGGGLSLIIVCL